MSYESKVAMDRGPLADRAARFGTTLNVEAATLGTRRAFHLHSINLSRSGALLKINEGSTAQIPFQTMTLIEIVIYPDNKVLFGKIRATAKVMRHDSANGIEKALFGIHMLEIEDQEEWEALMQRFETVQYAA